MTEVTQILEKIGQGDPGAAEELLPLVYNELRQLAAARMAQESPGHSLEATALVHEAYLRLVDSDAKTHWDSRGHFFAAAAEAMRRILVESARRKSRVKHGGSIQRRPLSDVDLTVSSNTAELFAINEALDRLARVDQVAANLVKLRYFVGLTFEEVADVLGMSVRSAYNTWDYARSWIRSEMLKE